MNLKRHTLSLGCLLALAAPAWSAAATDAAPSSAPAAPLQLEWDARLRHEQVDNDAFAEDARADTLRLRLGLRANFGSGWSGLLEGAGVTSAGDRYNSGANGRSQYPAITDPQGSELNQAWVGWQGDSFGATVGRQRIVLDNQRWVGAVGWRQHEQTFDAVALQWQPLAGLAVRYDWLDRVHRVSGRDALSPLARERRLDTHLFNAAWVRGAQQWTGYAYLHDDRDLATASSATYGARWTGKALQQGNGPGWTLELARQQDYADNPLHFTHRYWLLEPTWSQAGLTAKLGWEHLGGNGQHALQTPLATLHAFDGWADEFLVTPARGLENRYAVLTGPLGSTGKRVWNVTYHDFRADRTGAGERSRYGREWDASLGFPLVAGIQGLVKAARYRADGLGHDDTKLWLQFEWRGQRPPAAAR